MYAARLRRYLKSNNRKYQNTKYRNNEKQFYRTLSEKQINNYETPSEKQLTEFWAKIWSKTNPHHNEAPWLKKRAKTFKHRTKLRNSNYKRRIIQNHHEHA